MFNEDGGFLTTTVDSVVNWARSNSLMPMPMGLACCAIEMMGFAGPKYDAARFGSEAMRFSPRQADLMIVAGWCSHKMAHTVRRIWDQMAGPKWCIAQGACASTGGMHRCYGVVQGIDNFMPVDVYIPGCPPRPEAILHALMDIQEKIRNEQSVANDTHEKAGEYVPRHQQQLVLQDGRQYREEQAGREVAPLIARPTDADVAALA